MTKRSHSPLNNGVRRNGRRANRRRVAVVGGGIVGLAHAWAAAKRGHEVLLFERHPMARGASVRNFGMVWPIGQPNGPNHRVALQSRKLWIELLRRTNFWHQETGSLHLAYREDEWAVLEEFAELAPILGYDVELLPPEKVVRRSPAVKREKLYGALWSATEMCVDPRQIIAEMPSWLSTNYGVQLFQGVNIDRVGNKFLRSTDGSYWQVEEVIVATGKDFSHLYPELYIEAGFRQCKLQMMRTVAQPNQWTLGPMLAGGLTLRHYESFAICKGLSALKKRIHNETPELDEFGIHVMASQNGKGELILGDSHEYGENPSPFDNARIEELILDQLKGFLDLPDWTIQQRWHGIYVKTPDSIQFLHHPEDNVLISIASGGCGMTMSFGLAELHWSRQDCPTASSESTQPSAAESA